MFVMDKWTSTDLKVRINSQSFIDQTVPARVPGFKVHDVTLGFLIRQRNRGKL